MPELRIQIPKSLDDRINAAKPDFLTRSSFVCVLLDRTLTQGLTRAVDYAPTVSVGETREEFLPTENLQLQQPASEEMSSDLLTLEGLGLPLETKKINKTKNIQSENKKPRVNNKVRRTIATPEFDAFWKAYQSCSKKANCQSKFNAWECWQQLVPDVPPADLISAAQKAVEQVDQLEASGQFCAPLPDAFRWLRDERYVVLLEAHTPAQTQTVYL